MPAPTSILTRAQRRQVSRQIFRSAPTDTSVLPLAVALARRFNGLASTLLMGVMGGALVVAGSAFSIGGRTADVIAVVLVAYLAIYLGLLSVFLLRVRQFQRLHDHGGGR